MKSRITQVIIVILSFAVFSFGQSNSWNGLIPLQSNRADVEKLLGKPKDAVCNFGCDYENAKEKVFVSYAEKQCDQDGWNVPIDTVLRITVLSEANRGKTPADLSLDTNKFTVEVSDDLSQKWTNADEGLIYRFQQVIQPEFSSITYIPRKSDNHLRCNGFPPFMPERHYFTMETFLFYNPAVNRKEGLHNIYSRLDSFLISVYKEDKYKGYVLVYFDNKLSFKEYEKRLSKVKDHIYKLRKISPKQVSVIEGGMREESLIELYTLPNEWKPPAPNPTLPSPQFMKKQ